MFELDTPRLRIRNAEAENLRDLLSVYLSHPDFVRMNEGSRGEAGYYDLEMFQRDWWINRMMPGGHVLGIYLKATGEAVGQANFLEVNPEDGMPWLGLLLIAAPHQRQGLGREAFDALAEHFRATYGWPALRLGVLAPNTVALAFWRSLGFEQVAEKGEDARRVMVLERRLS